MESVTIEDISPLSTREAESTDVTASRHPEKLESSLNKAIPLSNIDSSSPSSIVNKKKKSDRSYMNDDS